MTSILLLFKNGFECYSVFNLNLFFGQFRYIVALQDAEIELNLKPILENFPGLN
jgi:hypothetical protein